MALEPRSSFPGVSWGGVLLDSDSSGVQPCCLFFSPCPSRLHLGCLPAWVEHSPSRDAVAFCTGMVVPGMQGPLLGLSTLFPTQAPKGAWMPTTLTDRLLCMCRGALALA